MNISRELFEKIDDEAYNIYLEGCQWDAIVLTVLNMAGIEIEGLDMTKALKWHGLPKERTGKK